MESLKQKSLNLGTGPFLEQALERITEETQRCEAEEGKLAYYDRQVSRQKQQQQQWLQQRRAENKLRKEKGEYLLPEIDPSNSIFKPITAPNMTEALLARSQLAICCDNVNSYVGMTLPKLEVSQSLLE